MSKNIAYEEFEQVMRTWLNPDIAEIVIGREKVTTVEELIRELAEVGIGVPSDLERTPKALAAYLSVCIEDGDAPRPGTTIRWNKPAT